MYNTPRRYGGIVDPHKLLSVWRSATNRDPICVVQLEYAFKSLGATTKLSMPQQSRRGNVVNGHLDVTYNGASFLIAFDVDTLDALEKPKGLVAFNVLNSILAHR